MSAIQSSVGLVSGIPIQDTVDQLMAISARPRDLIAQRNEGLAAERAAIDAISSLTLSTKFSLNNLDLRRTFTGSLVSSSDSSAVSASLATGGEPTPGSYSFTPLRQATSHQLVSDRFVDVSDLGTGTLSFGFGGQVDKGIDLSQINSGEGFVAGEIKITDRDGQSAVIDLRGARTIDEVLETINGASEIDVSASVSGDRLVLEDLTGGSGTLRVREVSGGQTAESLGLLNTAVGSTLTGDDIYGLSNNSELTSLRDGLGVRIDSSTDADIRVTLADGSSADIDLSGSQNLGDVIDKITSATDLGGNLSIAFNGDSDGLVLTDATVGSQLVVQDLSGGTAAADLGIATTGATGTLNGDRLISGLKDSLVSNLKYGETLSLETIQITDRAGTSDTVDLSSAETLGEVIDLINAGSPQVTASFNSARNGLVLTDTSGGSGSLIVANGASGTTADDLGLTVNAAVDSTDGGSLNRQVVGTATRLSDFNGGRGVRLADIRITDSLGLSSIINLDNGEDSAETLGDVIDLINDSPVNVTASINATGDGILLTDTAGGSGTLTVEESGSGFAAADLNLLGGSTATNQSGQQTIDGTTRYSIDLSTLDDSSGGTTLSSLKGGDGIDLGVFKITSKQGDSAFIDLRTDGGATSVQDVIDRINEQANDIGVVASLNEEQNGILLVDSNEASGVLTVEDIQGTSAADLLIAGEASFDGAADGSEIEGTGLFTFTEDNQLSTLADRINGLGAGVNAAVFNDGAGFRLSLTSDQTGAGSELLVDGLSGSIGFTETSRPGDAVAIFGGVSGIGGFAVTSSTNDFDNVIDGVSLSIERATGQTISIDVSADTQPIVDEVQGFVDAFNSLRSNLDTVADFDAETETTGILFGSSEVLRIEADLSRVLTGNFSVSGAYTNLRQVGVEFNSDGTLSFNATTLREAYEDNPTAVEDLFRDAENGVVARVGGAVDQLAGDTNSLLSSRSTTLQDTIDDNSNRIDVWNERLERERTQLLLEFIRLEETIALLQSNNSVIESIVPIQVQSGGG